MKLIRDFGVRASLAHLSLILWVVLSYLSLDNLETLERLAHIFGPLTTMAYTFYFATRNREQQ